MPSSHLAHVHATSVANQESWLNASANTPIEQQEEQWLLRYLHYYPNCRAHDNQCASIHRNMATDGQQLSLFKPKKRRKVTASTVVSTAPKTVSDATATVSASRNDSFSSLGLDEWLVNACKELGIAKPTPVQSNCIPETLSGKDIISSAPTGSGKVFEPRSNTPTA